VLTPLHSNKTIPASATHSKNRVRVRKTHIALVGGSCAFADFHVTPPLGRSMATIPPWPQHHQRKDCYQFDRGRRARRRESSSKGMGELDRKLWPLVEMIEKVKGRAAKEVSYFPAYFGSSLARLLKERLSSKLLHCLHEYQYHAGLISCIFLDANCSDLRPFRSRIKSLRGYHLASRWFW
jgi:hypothetical protein